MKADGSRKKKGKSQDASEKSAAASRRQDALDGDHRALFARLKSIFEMLQDGKYPNGHTIAKELEVSLSTARRDLEFMRDQWKLPMEYDERRFGYYFTTPVDRFPGIPVTEKELFALCVASKAIERYQGTALQRPLQVAFQKCLGQLDDNARFTLQNFDEVMSFRPFGPEDADLQLFELITKSICDRRGLQFEYRKPGEKTADLRHIYPYHLMQFNDRWYLIGHDLARNDIRKFVLGRMKNAELTAHKFTVPKDFDPKKYFEKSFGVMTGTGDYHVIIEMDAWLTDILRGRHFHPSQVWTEYPEGGSRLELHLGGLEEIEQSVLSWGTHATVIEPAALRDRIREIVTALIQRYAIASQPNPQPTAPGPQPTA